jgi:hypothetical protein
MVSKERGINLKLTGKNMESGAVKGTAKGVE